MNFFWFYVSTRKPEKNQFWVKISKYIFLFYFSVWAPKLKSGDAAGPACAALEELSVDPVLELKGAVGQGHRAPV